MNVPRILRRLKSAMNNDYAARLAKENERFAQDTDVHQLPEIFHYWSHKYLLPKLQKFSLTDPEQFFFYYARRQCKEFQPKGRFGLGTRPLRMVSLGSGNCDTEARLAKRLIDDGVRNFSIDCIDINDEMLKRGRDHAANLGVAEFVTPTKGDFNAWKPQRGYYDIVMANQALHHVVELEHLFAAISEAMHSESLFLTSDMIGRNGHQRWPEAMEALKPFWDELDDSYKQNRLLRRFEKNFMNHDCSMEGFEGIRAQDILPLLNEQFDYELFLPFANIILVFIDRPFGHNFDVDKPEDLDFIDRVHARDEEGILSGELKPTQMLAVLRKKDTWNKPVNLVDPRLTPEACVRPV